jgi:hypothetical protein
VLSDAGSIPAASTKSVLALIACNHICKSISLLIFFDIISMISE